MAWAIRKARSRITPWYQHAAEIYARAGDTERSKEIAAKIKAIQ